MVAILVRLAAVFLGTGLGTLQGAPVGAWSSEDVVAWTRRSGFEDHAAAIDREAIDGPALLELTDDDLRSVGISRLGDRKRFRREVRRLQTAAIADGSEVGDQHSLGLGSRAAPGVHQCAPSKRPGFNFGNNWLHFLDQLLEEEGPLGSVDVKKVFGADGPRRRIHSRMQMWTSILQEEFGISTLTGLTFVDVGAGHGLASLAAIHLNASMVLSIDVDARPVQELQRTIAAQPELGLQMHPWQAWEVRNVSILDTDFINSDSIPLGDLVWSYGVLHHTGNVKQALLNIAWLVRPGGLLKLHMHTAEEMAFPNDWLDFKRDWSNRPNWFKEEALVAYAVSELWVEIENLVQSHDVKKHVPGWATPTNFGTFEVIRHAVHARFWKYSQGRGMDWITDALDWLGGYPYEFLTVAEVLQLLRAAPQPLRAVHGSWDGFAGLLLTPALPGLPWPQVVAPVRELLGDRIVKETGSLWFEARKLISVVPQHIAHFGVFLDHMCHSVSSLDLLPLPLPTVCSQDFLSKIPGRDCWVTFWELRNDGEQDLTYFHMLEDGDIMGWGAPNTTLCVPGAAASFRFFPFGMVLFSLGDDSDPTNNGRKYTMLAPRR